MSSLSVSLTVLICLIIVSFLYGLFTRNYSTVDRLWSLLPPIYMVIWMPAYSNNPRYIIVFVIVLLWAVRLTSNFAIKGGYRFSFKTGFTEEDYRWAVLKKQIPGRFLFELFNLFFISGFQMVLIFMFTLPLYYYGKITGPVRTVEIVLYAVHLCLLLIELYADILQFRFYRRRNKEPWKNLRRYQLGFNTFGPWKFSRHPNYVCEISQWIVVFLYLWICSGRLHYSGIGAAVLVALFAGSTNFVETITASKYPEYAEWKKLTSVWIPVKSFFTLAKKRTFLGN